MAHTARSRDEKREYFDSPEELDRKVAMLADWVKHSKHMIAFTGAGISTAAGIPDFRSGMKTCLDIGPGVWELRAQLASRDEKHKSKLTMALQAIPTATHMMLVKLVEDGILRCVVSQNCDGLHRRSGLATTTLFELHGNANIEKCLKCKKEYLRDFKIRPFPSHMTGNKCDDPKCGAFLRNNIINFGETLPTDVLQTSFDHAEKADLCLAMGSSLTVTPAAEIPQTVANYGGRLVVVNLQTTPLDDIAKLRIFAKCDDVSTLLMEKLGLTIPPFKLRRKIIFSTTSDGNDKTEVSVQGADMEGNIFSYLKEVRFELNGKETVTEKWPYSLVVNWSEQGGGGGGEGGEGRESVSVKVTVVFHGNYGEPTLEKTLAVTRSQSTSDTLSIEYEPLVVGGGGGGGGGGVGWKCTVDKGKSTGGGGKGQDTPVHLLADRVVACAIK